MIVFFFHAVHGFEQVSYTTLEGDVLSDINFVPDIKGTGAVGYMPQGTIKALEDTASMFASQKSVQIIC